MTELFTVKPLKWVKRGKSFDALFGHYRYSVEPKFNISDGYRLLVRHSDSNIFYDIRPCTSIEEGKRMAEKHCRKHVMQFLVPYEGDK